MKHSYLEVTYRKGQVLAAYYYLPRNDGDSSAWTEPVGEGMLVDFASDGRPLGIEITSPTSIDLESLNAVLRRLGQAPALPEDLAPLSAA